MPPRRGRARRVALFFFGFFWVDFGWIFGGIAGGYCMTMMLCGYILIFCIFERILAGWIARMTSDGS